MSRANAADRARRLLALLPHLQPGEPLSLADAAAAVDADPGALAEDLVTLSMCGVPPYSPDALIAAFIEGDHVVTWAEPPALSGPVRLSAEETQALVAALEAAGRTRSDPLVETLLTAAGPDSLDTADLRARVVARATDVLGVLAAAIDGTDVLELRYMTGSTGVVSERAVHPLALAEHDGTWYLTAFCETAGEDRVFRVDRVETARPVGRAFDRAEAADAFDQARFGDAGLPVATVVFDAGEPVEPRRWPGAEIETAADGTTVMRIPVADPRWLARRVAARLGAARVVDPPAVQESVARAANTIERAHDG